MILMAPKDGLELKQMFKWALLQKQPVAIRYPRGNVPELGLGGSTQEIQLGVPEVLKSGERVALLAYGAMIPEALKAAEQLKASGLEVTVVNLRFAKPLSAEHLAPILTEHEWIISIEDHALMGGVGSAILEMIQEEQLPCGKLIRLGIPDEFITYMSREQQFSKLGLDAASIATMVAEKCQLRLVEASV
jgi:1-deoxy-D-xylulose-5-phosphate synthase